MPAHAAATIPFTEALYWSYNPDAIGIGIGNPCCDASNIINSSPPLLSSVTCSQSGGWDSVDAFTSADLATAQLEMRGAAPSGDGSFSPYIQSNAIFGDGFRALTRGG